MGIEIRIREDLGGPLVSASIAAELYALVLHDEFGALQDGAAGHDLVCEAHLLLAEVGQVAYQGCDAVDLLDIVLLQLGEHPADQVGYDGHFVHRFVYTVASLKGCMGGCPRREEKCLQ